MSKKIRAILPGPFSTFTPRGSVKVRSTYASEVPIGATVVLSGDVYNLTNREGHVYTLSRDDNERQTERHYLGTFLVVEGG